MPRGSERSGQRMSHFDRAKRRRQMALDVKQGATVAVVAVRYQVTLATVRNACLEHKIDWENGPAG